MRFAWLSPAKADFKFSELDIKNTSLIFVYLYIIPRPGFSIQRP
ncbi:hypothetical protein C1G86_0360 [Dehalococcoides mccartyi]|uniref:Uncharacterized protein n=1 Tax=Dehalococcoides mccartyi TaxID=61435 RepID=A0A328ETQ6_9CHLR|nr:hypothetical protein C1G86_0360 [Dehalococcoides mccartyi]